MPQLWCPRCKRNQDTVEVSRTVTTVTYQCVVCGKLIPVVIVVRSGKHTGRPYRCWED